MTWTASSEAASFSISGSESIPSDLRSLVHQELRLLAYSEPRPTVRDAAAANTPPRTPTLADLHPAMGSLGPAQATYDLHTITPAVPSRTHRWSPAQWR